MLVSQQVNTLYFMENVPIRNSLNPAFQPINQYYLSLPIIGFTQFNIGNNSLTFKDVIYEYNGQTISFLHPNGDINRFYNTLKSTTNIRADFQTNLLSFGFRSKKSYWNFSLVEKVDGYLGIPKDFAKLSLFGTTSIDNNTFNLSALQTDITAYTEAGIGYSNYLNDNLSVGIKVKFLMGSANFSNANNSLAMQLGMNEWIVNGSGSANISSPVRIDIANNYQSVAIYPPTRLANWLKPSGYGTGIDLGAVYSLSDRINLSASIVDLGFIKWTKNVRNINYGIDYTFDGVAQISSSQGSNSLKNVYSHLTTESYLVDSLTNAIQTSANQSISNNSYFTGTTCKLNLGVEYDLLHNLFSLGLLSRTFIFKKSVSEELTTSINAHPVNWFNASASYSLVNGRFGTIGAGIGFRTGFIHWFAAADYIPFQKTTILVSQSPKLTIPLPYNASCINFAMGINMVFDINPETVKKQHFKKTEQVERSNYSNKTTSKARYKIKSKYKTILNPNCRCEYY